MVAVAGAALAAACAGDPLAPAGEGDDLSSAEAAAIAEFMTGSAFDGWSFDEAGQGASASVAPAGHAGGSSEPIQFDVAIDITSGCPEGGSLSVSGSVQGSVDGETESGTLTLGIDISAAGCRFPAEGTVFTVDTRPQLELDGDFAWEGGEPVGEQTFSYRGGIAWSAEDGRSGSCAFDLQVTRFEDGTLAESGTACGVLVGDL